MGTRLSAMLESSQRVMKSRGGRTAGWSQTWDRQQRDQQSPTVEILTVGRLTVEMLTVE